MGKLELLIKDIQLFIWQGHYVVLKPHTPSNCINNAAVANNAQRQENPPAI